MEMEIDGRTLESFENTVIVGGGGGGERMDCTVKLIVE